MSRQSDLEILSYNNLRISKIWKIFHLQEKQSTKINVQDLRPRNFAYNMWLLPKFTILLYDAQFLKDRDQKEADCQKKNLK